MKKIAIVGNGSIGTLTAILVKEAFPDSEVSIYGNLNRNFAASTAAGAMANVYAEMERSSEFMGTIQRRYLEMGNFGSRDWISFLEKSKGMNCRTSKDTFVYLRNESSAFEVANYETMREISIEDGVAKDLTKKEIQEYFPEQSQRSCRTAVQLRGEYSISTDSLFKHLDIIVQSSGIRKVTMNVSRVDEENNVIVLNNGDFHYFDRLIVCAGAHSRQLFSSESKVLSMFQGVGVALLVNEIKSIDFQKLAKGVFRSVNRGGAQCGIHVVPRENGGIYIGAGNYVSKIEVPNIRMDSVRYLIETVEKDLIGRNAVYDFAGSLVLGLRPRSLDGFPMIGPINQRSHIFFITATNRAGLTWAPFLAKQAVNWLKDETLSDLISGWEPDRSPISFGSREESLHYFVQSRVANSIEHGLISREQVLEKSKEFRLAAELLEGQVRTKLNLSPDVSINPDNWGAIVAS